MAVCFTFPLETDPTGVVTLLGLEHRPDERRVDVVLTGGQELTVPVPAEYTGLTRPEQALMAVGVFLKDIAVAIEETGAASGVYPWPFDHLPNETWLLHVQQLAALRERLPRARASLVAHDPRVREQMGRQVEAAEMHTEPLREWISWSRPQVKALVALIRQDADEESVREVLADLSGVVEDESADPNPGLPRLPVRPPED